MMITKARHKYLEMQQGGKEQEAVQIRCDQLQLSDEWPYVVLVAWVSLKRLQRIAELAEVMG